MDWQGYAQKIVERVSEHFGLNPPKVIVGLPCPGGSIACYVNGTIVFSSPEAIREEVVLHELLHHAAANGRRSFTCEVCGHPVIENGSDRVKCYVCHAEYVREYPEEKPSVWSVVAPTIASGVLGAVLGAWITGAFPLPGEPLEAKIEKSQKITASFLASAFAGMVIGLLKY